ncbi:SH2 domain-containing protein 4A [Nothobranchius furzeri]|uniref:SH2 domain containing 4B n=1 Tax=Nothobranchius furzeri TaxID=105023 RepID=A0A1A8AXH7_NOTFU|nr:SH2 domain-containing protein 4A [Nothobranchius furzeri]KAF7227832.1 SH2 domain-containing protein 4A-like [Nothobranchius furzeri]
MLAKILKDMWVDPEVLEALNEEQKQILFLKMRQEQVRRWKEREEKETREGGDSYRPRKVYRKRVTWLLGRDGDVSVSIIGEEDEFRSCKLLKNLNRLHSDSMNGIQTVDLLPEREAQQLSFKDGIKLPVTDINTQEDSTSAEDQSSEEDSRSADNLKDPAEDSSDCESGSGSDCVSVVFYRPHHCNHGNQPLKAPPLDTEMASIQDRETPPHSERSECSGHVAQLRRVFTDDPHRKPPTCWKPPIPAKPAHLQRGAQH